MEEEEGAVRITAGELSAGEEVAESVVNGLEGCEAEEEEAEEEDGDVVVFLELLLL